MRILWFGEGIKQAVDASRIHHQIFPMEVAYDYGVLDVSTSSLFSTCLMCRKACTFLKVLSFQLYILLLYPVYLG
jgi:hypothetical protein